MSVNRRDRISLKATLSSFQRILDTKGKDRGGFAKRIGYRIIYFFIFVVNNKKL